MNLVTLTGRVGQDPKIKEFDNGKLATFTLAVTERGYKTKDGKEIPERTDWFNIVAKYGLAKLCEQYVKKGTPLLIVGKIKTRSYEDNNGQTRYVTEIHVDELELLSSGNKDNHEAAPAPEPQTNNNNDMPF